jgi:arginine decarboxylase
MRTKYIDLIEQTFDFPQNEFFLREERLFFHGIDLMRLVHEHGTPLKFHYLPQISNNIQRAKGWFREAIMNLGYQGNYYYSYCTKVLTLLLYSTKYSRMTSILKPHLPLM